MAAEQSQAGPANPDAPSAAGVQPGIRQDQLTYTHYEALGEEAYVRARELEAANGLDDPRTIDAYREAGTNLTAVTWMAPNEAVMNDPVRMLRISDSLAKQVQADAVLPYREQQYDFDGNPVEIDRRENLRRISSELLVEAGRLLTDRAGREDGADGSAEPAGAISAAVAEATEEAGDTAEGEVIVLRPDLVAKTAEFAIEQLTTGSHELSPEAAQSELIAA